MSGKKSATDTIDKLRVPKSAEIVANDLRAKIVRGVLREGDTLPHENDLAGQYGVSRPTLREAVRILESENLIRISRGARHGALILRPDPKVATRYFSLLLQSNEVTTADVYKARSILEPPAARIVAESKNVAAPGVLRLWVERSRDCLENDREFGAVSTGFFRTLVEFSEIQTLILLSNMLTDILTRNTQYIWVASAGQKDHKSSKLRAIKAKENLIKMIESGDGAGAEQYLQQHMQAVAKLLDKWKLAGRVVDFLDEEY
ncbi:MAG: FadR family transcriptional regulator [Halieaceae bacterium]|nr:FadR family transcriptional regulator [Halieaceae bacterium]